MSLLRPRSLMACVAGAVAIGLALTSCSSGTSGKKREYAVPSSMCGTSMPPSALEPLLPAGKTISARRSGSPGYARCQVSVDGKVVLSSIIERWSPRTTLTKVAFGTYGITAHSVHKEDERYIVADSAAVGHVECAAKRKDGAEVFTVIRTHHGSVDTAAMEKAISEFTDAAATSKECTELNT
ncbi:hypothetical protein AB0D42_29830 [Streptomyces sp. NPDC048304]|uniref:hypothetical protein n=1 Tax=Streptomyces sp. NPDC048304 TaxID=3154820 RepID=UPI0033FAE574